MSRQSITHFSPVLLLILLVTASLRADDNSSDGMRLVDHKRIWDGAPHNAFTDLIRFKQVWYCAFREAKGHVSPRGTIRVLRSSDGKNWASTASLVREDADLRDAKMSIAPDGRLMLLAAASWHGKDVPVKRQPMVWLSNDGSDWSEGREVGEKDFWLWRVTWREDSALAVGYHVRNSDRFARLYQSRDGKKYQTIVARMFDEGNPSESTIRFLEDGTALCLMRRDGSPNSGLLGRASSPYTEWKWQDLKKRIGGPNFIQIPDGRMVAVCRLYDGGARTSACWLDPEKGTLNEALKLPSGGDTSYAGLVWHDDRLWISYYSSHEGKSSIYLARVAIDSNED